MSRNKEIKFAKNFENLLKKEYKGRVYNYLLNDEWFESLPKDLKEIIIKVDEKSFDDYINYESLLEDLEVEIKVYVNNKFNSNYNCDEATYLLALQGYYEHLFNEYFGGGLND